MSLSVLVAPSSPLTSAQASNEVIPALLAEARAASVGRREEIEREVVRLTLPVARSLANRYRNRGIPVDDLFQVACLALVQAIRGFDPERGLPFLPYAIPTMRGSLRKHFRDHGWAVRPPRRIQELQAEIAGGTETLTQRLHRSPTPTELATHLGVAVDEVIEAMTCQGYFAPSSLDVTYEHGDDHAPAARLGGDDVEFQRAEARMLAVEALKTLSGRDRQIVEMRFFHEMTQQEIGEVVGVTQMQISRVLSRILSGLREQLGPQAA